MMPMRRIVLVLVAVALSSSPAAADVVAKADRNDVAGRLDIRSVSHGHRGQKRLVHSIDIYARWRNRALRNESSWISLHFDRRARSFRDDRYLRIDWSKSKGLYARITTFGVHGPGEFIARVAVWRPTSHSVRVRFPKRRLGADLRRYRWSAITSFENEGRCASSLDSGDQGGCIDYAPGKRQPPIVHDLQF